jgi:hypothetical protein
MCEARRIESDIKAMAPEDAAGFTDHKRKLLRMIERGELVVDESGDPTLAVARAAPLKFKRPTGATFILMDDGRGQITVTAKIIAELTGRNAADIAALDGRDFQQCCTLANFFLADR